MTSYKDTWNTSNREGTFMMIRMTIIRTMMLSEPQCRKIFCRSNDYKDVKLIVNNYISFVESVYESFL